MFLKEVLFQLGRVLLPGEKRRMFLLSGALFLCALLELIGIGAALSVVALFVDPGLFDREPLFREILLRTGAGNDPQKLLIGFCAAAALFYVVKAVILLAVNRLQVRFVYGIAERVAGRLAELYVRTGFAFHLERRSGESLEKVRQTRITFTESVNGIMMLISECLVVLLLLAGLLCVSPATASLIFLVLAFLSGLAFLFYRRILARESGRVLSRGSRVNQYLMTCMNSIREIKLSGRTDPVLASGKTFLHEACSSEERLFALSQQPRFLIEGGAVVIGIGAVAFLALSGIPLSSIALRISFIGLGLTRMMPSFSRINYYAVRIKANSGVFREIVSDLETIQPEELNRSPETNLTLQKEIRLENLSFSYGGKEIFRHLDLVIPARSSLAVIGPTGAGKSTFLDLVSGLLVPAEGRITSDGTGIRENLGLWRQKIGYVPQTIRIDDASVLENVAFGVPPEKIDPERVKACLRTAQAYDFVMELEQGLDTVLGEQGVRLSGGQRQRIGIARALYPDPEILLFDEATSALDTATEAEFVKALEALKDRYTILIAAHRLSTVEHCTGRFEISGKQGIL